LATVFLVTACRHSTVDGPGASALPDSGETYFPAESWRRETSASAGFDPSRIAALETDIATGRYGAIDAVIVVRYGHLIVERYNNWPADRAHTMQSASKSITSLLIGILQSKRLDGAASNDNPVGEILRRYAAFAASMPEPSIQRVARMTR
jgi:hypothetical protein